MLFDKIVRPLMYRAGRGDPERVHEQTMAALTRFSTRPEMLAGLRRMYAVEAPATVFGIRFPNPVGLAAGMDKDGRALPAWPALGFGFVEVGTVTALEQPGNPRPRLYQLPRSAALINRMGFNNAGSAALAERLDALGPLPVPLGVSIGKSKKTPLDQAVFDYTASLRRLYDYADYFAINVSSPNTPGLRGLQDREALDELLSELQSASKDLASKRDSTPTPLLVKLAPDLSDDALDELLTVCSDHGVAGLIATNTTLARSGLHRSDEALADEAGGLSGKPLFDRSLQVVRRIAGQSSLPVIGVGGISSPDDALRMLDAGASLVQLYTAFIYSGPGLVRNIGKACAARS